MRDVAFGWIRFIYIVVLVFVSSCATVEKPKIVDITTQVPQKEEINQKEPEKTIKRRVAIARFTNESSYGGGRFSTKLAKEMNKQAVDILSNKLLQTEKFILLERADADKILAETQNSNGKIESNRIPAEYLIVGSISEFGRKDQGEVGIFSRTRRQIAFAKVFIRMIDVRTQEIIYSEEGLGESTTESGSVFGVGERAGYDSSLNDQAIDMAISSLSSNIIQKLTEKEWIGYILGESNGQLLLTGGPSQNIIAGDEFEIIKSGKQIYNPQSGKNVSLPGKSIGKIVVQSSIGNVYQDEISFCELVDGNLQDILQNLSSIYVSPKS